MPNVARRTSKSNMCCYLFRSKDHKRVGKLMQKETAFTPQLKTGIVEVINKKGKNYKALERIKRITKGIRLGIPKRSTKIMRD